MEFERGTPATAQDIALADAPKVTLQPVHGDVRAEPTTTNYVHHNEAVFKFESDSTNLPTDTTTEPIIPHKTAFVVAIVTALTFGGCLAFAYMLR